ncbi:MAG: leucine-rich repeat domain-containing protein, partial [Clostridia bacterium]|nr:leucine-rich repeat domain-containing protein [Clostridia bacterium]
MDFPSTLKKIGDSAFEGCYLSSVGWKEGLEEIGANAFARCGVQTLSLPSTVKTIGEAAFKNGSIRKLYIGKNIESIGPEAFANNFLDRVELLTDRMIQIDETAFVGNTNDTYVYLRWNVPYDVYKDYEHLFLNIYEGYTYLYIQAPIKDPSLGLEYPADGTDSYNQDVWVSYNGTQPNLMTWYSWNRIPITTLGDGLFKGNQTIKTWYCSHEFTMHHIGNEAFADSSVEFVDLYHEIYTIGEHAFRNCVNIREITLPETLTSIAANAFEGCTGLEKITVLCDPSILPAGLLDSCTALKEISAGENATDEQKAALQKA